MGTLFYTSSDVRHLPPYIEETPLGKQKRQLWDGLGVATIGIDPLPIKDAHLGRIKEGGQVIISPPLLVYEAEPNRNGLRIARLLLDGERTLSVSPYDIGVHQKDSTRKAKRQPTSADIADAIQTLNQFGTLGYIRVGHVYVLRENWDGKQVMTPEAVKDEVIVSDRIAQLLIEHYMDRTSA